jgi:hypothetical protein
VGRSSLKSTGQEQGLQGFHRGAVQQLHGVVFCERKADAEYADFEEAEAYAKCMSRGELDVLDLRSADRIAYVHAMNELRPMGSRSNLVRGEAGEREGIETGRRSATPRLAGGGGRRERRNIHGAGGGAVEHDFAGSAHTHFENVFCVKCRGAVEIVGFKGKKSAVI